MTAIFEKYINYTYSPEDFETLVKSNEINPNKYVYYWINNKQSKRFISIDHFNECFSTYVKNRIEKKEKTTSPDLCYSIGNWNNLIYIDIDYYYDLSEGDEVKDVINFNEELAKRISKLVSKNIDNALYMTFIPSKLKETDFKVKGGIHTFVFCKESFEDIQAKTDMVYNIFESDEEFMNLCNEHKEKLIDQNGNQIGFRHFIDEATIKRSTGLLPYSQKDKTSRTYKLYANNVYKVKDDIINFVVESKSSKKIITRTYNASDDCLGFAEYYNADKNIMYKKIINKDRIREVYGSCINIKVVKDNDEDFEDDSWVKTILKIDSFIFSFMDGLGVLCYDPTNEDRQHHFYRNVFVNWDTRNKFISRLTEFYLAALVSNLGKYMPTKKSSISERLIELMAPLFVRLGKLNSTEKIEAAQWKCEKIDTKFDLYKKYGGVYFEWINATPKQQEKLRKHYTEESPRTLAKINGIKSMVKKSFSAWSTFVIEEIMRPLTFEIEPFDWKKYSRGNTGLSFDDVLPIISKTGRSLSSCINKTTEYIKQLKNLNKMFIFCVTYEKGINKVDNIIGEIILAYIKTYVMYIEDDYGLAKDNYKSIYIYNVQQTDGLCKYPYNQWIIDKEGNLGNWISVIYKNLFEPLLDTSATEQNDGLDMPFKMLEATKFVEKIQPGKLISSLKSPFSNSTATKNLMNNVLATYESERHVVPTPEDPERSEYFGMRNGILKWTQKENGKWTYEFRRDNRDIRLSAYTLVNFIDPNTYDKNNEYYVKLKEVIRQTYPEDDEREYILSLFSTVIVPFIKKDQMLVVFGTGGDGKSTMDMILTNMLGNSQTGGVNYFENKRKKLLSVPVGYAGNVNASVFTHAKSQSNGHDEGGKINMAKKTFVVGQEPDQGRSLITNVIKDLTSGSLSHGRRIHGKEITFINNALIVMETNKVLSYDTVDDAVKRRMVIYKHQTKFTTNVNESQMKNVKWHFPANTKLIIEIQTTTEYWDALFQILLEHALKILNKNCANLSDIKPPKSVVDFTQHSFNISSPLLLYLYETYEESENSYMFVKDVIEQILEQDISQRESGQGSMLKSSNINGKRSEIIEELQKKYNGSFFRVNRRYYKTTGKGMKSNWQDEFEKNTLDLTIDEIISEHTDGEGALTDLSQDSRMKYENLIIKGFAKKIIQDLD